MTKFNKATTIEKKLAAHPDATKNHEGGLAFKASAEMELYLRCVSSFMEDTYYQKASAQLTEVQNLIAKTSRDFVLKLANYARNEMHLRSIPVMLLTEATKEVFAGDTKGVSKAMVTDYAPKIIKRADELTEVIAYAINVAGSGNKKNLSNALKKGIAKSFHNFDEYQFAKYNRKGDVTLKDAVLLTHPKPRNDEEKALFKRILDGELKTPETWEVAISGKGSTAENWNEIAPKMGLMALLRNLRNFEEKGAEAALKIAYAALRNKEHVQKSKILPFRFLSASREVSRSATRDALMDALDLSVANMPRLNGSVAIYADTSGSMSTPVSKKSKVSCVDVATLMAAMAAHLVEDGNDYEGCAFATEVAKVPISKRDSILTNQKRIHEANTNGWGTDAWKIFKHLGNTKRDIVMIFSDMQCYNTSNGSQSLASMWKHYKREVNPNAILVSVDLSAYGSLQFPQNEPDVILLGGFSESIFKLISAYQERVSVLDIIKEKF